MKYPTIYLNMRTAQGVETVDEFTREIGQSPIDFRKYVNQMAQQYRISGMPVYKSGRCTRDWNNK